MEFSEDQLEKMNSMSEKQLKRYVENLYKEKRRPTTLGYARVSTKGQEREGYSLESQEKQLRGAGAEKVFRESYTGTSAERPVLSELLSSLKEKDTLVITKLDRLARNAIEGQKIIEELIERHVTVHILDMGVLDDSPSGKLMWQMLTAFAEFERNLIVERTQAGKAQAKANNPNFREGRPRKYSEQKMKYAMELLGKYSYKQVADITGISRATLAREKKRSRENG